MYGTLTASIVGLYVLIVGGLDGVIRHRQLRNGVAAELAKTWRRSARHMGILLSMPTYWRFGAQRGASRACESHSTGADSALPPATQLMPVTRPTRLPSGSVNCASEIDVPGMVIGSDAILPPSCVARSSAA